MTGTEDVTRLRAAIEALLAETAGDIRSYPPPIPACDAQFNHLLELRRGLPGELDRLDGLIRQGPGKMADFLDSSPHRDDILRHLAK